MSSIAWPKRLFLLDVSRGIASLGVVLFHWVHFSWEEGVLGSRYPGFELSDQPLYAVLKVFYEYGDLGVNYFFILSGFIFFWLYRDLIHTRQIGFIRFWVHRFSRLYPLHLVTLILVALLQFIFARLTDHFFIYPANNTYHFILNLGFLHGIGVEKGWSFNHPTWSVSVEMFLYLVFFLSALKLRSRFRFCVAVSFANFFLSFYFPSKLFLGLALFFLGGALFYIAGYFSSGRRHVIWFAGAMSLVSWLLALVHCYVVELSGIIEALGEGAPVVVSVFQNYFLLGSTILYFAVLEISKGNLLKALSWVGDITYSTYLLHFPLNVLMGMLVVGNLLEPLFFLNPFYLGLYLVVLISVSYGCYHWFERPVQRVIRRYLASIN